METIEYRTFDKSGWGEGPWQAEPDKLQWPDPETGLPCLIVRGPMGALCGYVGVTDAHPWHSKCYSDAIDACLEICDSDSHWDHSISSRIEVHGGLTFSDACQHSSEDNGICHLPAPGEPDNVWWFGFDCGHAFDLIPQMMRYFGDQTYRDVPYVKAQIRSLAAQLAAHAKNEVSQSQR